MEGRLVSINVGQSRNGKKVEALQRLNVEERSIWEVIDEVLDGVHGCDAHGKE